MVMFYMNRQGGPGSSRLSESGLSVELVYQFTGLLLTAVPPARITEQSRRLPKQFAEDHM